jgi:hypothetical protein
LTRIQHLLHTAKCTLVIRQMRQTKSFFRATVLKSLLPTILQCTCFINNERGCVYTPSAFRPTSRAQPFYEQHGVSLRSQLPTFRSYDHMCTNLIWMSWCRKLSPCLRGGKVYEESVFAIFVDVPSSRSSWLHHSKHPSVLFKASRGMV